MPEILRLLARGTACMPDPHGSDDNPQRRRIIGRAHKEIKPGEWAWVATGAVEEHPVHNDLIKAVEDGVLLPADEATAARCGVPFTEEARKAATDGAKIADEVKAAKAKAVAAAKKANDPPKTTGGAGDKESR